MTPETADPDFRRLGERVEAAMRRLGIPGAAVGVVDGDRVLAAGFGVTNVEHPLPVDPDDYQYFDVSVQSWVSVDRAELDEPLADAVASWIRADWPWTRLDRYGR